MERIIKAQIKKIALGGPLLGLFLLLGCVGRPPFEVYNISDTALNAAKGAGAPVHSPGNWAKANEYFDKAEAAYKLRKYEDAKKFFAISKKYSEKAENVSRMKKFKSGEVEL